MSQREGWRKRGEKHFSLLQTFVNYGTKTSVNTGSSGLYHKQIKIINGALRVVNE